MKNNLKRILSVLLVATMLFGMSVTSFAAGNSDVSETQSVSRGAAKPITSISLEYGYWNAAESCYMFKIRENGIGSDTVKLDNKRLWAYQRDPIYQGFDRTEVVGWDLYYKSDRIYSAGTYRLDATFVSTNDGKVWNLKRTYTLTQDMIL